MSASRPSPLLIDYVGAIALARAVLAKPPAFPHIERPPATGELVAEFALPLDLLPPTNRTRGGQAWRLGQIKRDCMTALRYQGGDRNLVGGRLELYAAFDITRPQFRCVRFSSAEPDKYNDGFKCVVDCLVKLGFAADDSPRFLDLYQTWEPLPADVPFGTGFGYIEVRTGDSK